MFNMLNRKMHLLQSWKATNICWILHTTLSKFTATDTTLLLFTVGDSMRPSDNLQATVSHSRAFFASWPLKYARQNECSLGFSIPHIFKRAGHSISQATSIKHAAAQKTGATNMQLKERHESLKGAFRTSLSPPVWKDQLKQRCMQRLRQDRHKLLAKLRSPDATTSITDEMKRLVYKEERKEEDDQQSKMRADGYSMDSHGRHPAPPQQQRRRQRPSGARHPVFELQKDDAMRHHTSGEYEEEGEVDLNYASIEELVAAGKLSEGDYLDIVHSLEDELLAEMYGDGAENEEELAEQMVEFEEASLEAMLAGMDLADSDSYFDDECEELDGVHGNGEAVRFVSSFFECVRPAYSLTHCVMSFVCLGGFPGGMHVLCPICKIGSLRETTSGYAPTIACSCGFSYQMQQEPLHGVLEDFQEIIAAAFMVHRYVVVFIKLRVEVVIA